MPIAKFQLEDGRVARFEVPDGTSPEQAQAMIKAEIAKQGIGGQLKAAEQSQPRGATGSFSGGATGSWEQPPLRDIPLTQGQRFKQGFINDSIAGLQGLAADTAAALLAPEWAKRKKAEIQQKEAEYQNRRQASGQDGFDLMRLAGNMVNPVNLGIVAATKIPPGATLPQAMTYGGLQGGMMGAAAPVYGEGSRAGQAAMGIGGGVLAAPVAAGVSRLVKPNVDPHLALLRESGVTPTIGQSMGGFARKIEDKAMSLPIMGDAITSARQSGLDQFQVAGYNRALAPIGAKHSGKVGFAGMQEVRETLQSAYDDVLPKLSFKPDAKFAQDTAQLKQMVSSLEPTDQRIFDSAIAKIMNRSTPQGNMSGVTFKQVESEIGNDIAKLAKDQSYGKQQVHDALQQFRELMREGLQRSNPMYAQRLQNINEGWANYSILRDAASSAQAAKNEAVFTPAQLAAGVSRSAKRQGQAVGKGKLSEGRALMQDLANAGQQVLPSQYPDSGTAGRVIQGALLGGAAAGQVPFTLGTLGGLSAAATPYLPGVRQGMDLLMNARPQGADLVADAMRRYPGLLAPVFTSLVNGGQ